MISLILFACVSPGVLGATTAALTEAVSEHEEEDED